MCQKTTKNKHFCAMETRDHSKNGASQKSYTKKKSLIKNVFISLAALTFFSIYVNAQTQFRFYKNEIELIVGEEYALNVQTNPSGQAVSWTSSSTSKATVEGDYEEGKVIAKASGTLTISATFQGETISCKVTIYDTPLSGATIEGVTWAAYNVNAPNTFTDKVTDRGMLYQWNSKKSHSKSPSSQSFEQGTAWNSENDPCPSGWRLPTLNEVQTLKSKVINSTYGHQRGQLKGRLATINDQKCVVMKFENSQHLVFWSEHNNPATYWTSTPNSSDKAYNYNFFESAPYSPPRYHALILRCVKNK